MNNPPYPDSAGFLGAQDSNTDTSQYNALAFLVQQLVGQISTMTLVQVIGVTNAGGVEPVGFVDVHPLVNQIDGLGNAIPHGVLYRLPYCRVQGGVNAIIMDPKAGDIGWAGFCDHDISSVKATKAQANPGSRRRFDMSDGVYFGGLLNGAPQNYVQFTDAGGINVISTAAVTVSAPDVTVHASQSYAQDVNGYGSRTTHEGGADFTVDFYTTGAVVTTVEHGWSPPEIP